MFPVCCLIFYDFPTKKKHYRSTLFPVPSLAITFAARLGWFISLSAFTLDKPRCAVLPDLGGLEWGKCLGCGNAWTAELVAGVTAVLEKAHSESLITHFCSYENEVGLQTTKMQDSLVVEILFLWCFLHSSVKQNHFNNINPWRNKCLDVLFCDCQICGSFIFGSLTCETSSS